MKRFMRTCIAFITFSSILKLSYGQEKLLIEETILKDKSNFYYIDFANYSSSLKGLPIGVFDSGTGGLTVLDALVNFDQNNNTNNTTNGTTPDGKLDFATEKFIYLADQANMPYGNYNAVGKDDLLKEHIIKDFQFLLSNKYYTSPSATKAVENKQQVKAIVIACNTATAYGYADAVSFLNRSGLKIPVIGVINAAVNGTLSFFDKTESGNIAVFATVGTIASKGYERTLLTQIKEGNYTGNIQIFNQGGHGIAEAVDEEADYIGSAVKVPREGYRGPSLSNDNYKIDKTLLDVYNFNFDKNKMLCDTENTEDCTILQLNDTENYIRYHLVSLLEQIRRANGAQPLKALILGCTHYPYLMDEINQVLDELREYTNDKGELVYQHLIHSNVNIIDPSIYVAQELYNALKDNALFNTNGDMSTESEFFISVPNTLNSDISLDANGRFTYDYKYGRLVNNIQEYVKIVPFDKTNISNETLLRFKKSIPNTYELIKNFSIHNEKNKHVEIVDRIN